MDALKHCFSAAPAACVTLFPLAAAADHHVSHPGHAGLHTRDAECVHQHRSTSACSSCRAPAATSPGAALHGWWTVSLCPALRQRSDRSFDFITLFVAQTSDACGDELLAMSSCGHGPPMFGPSPITLHEVVTCTA